MRIYLLVSFVLLINLAKAQKVDSIYVNLYTDSLKKGTYNYINIDGRMSNGRYLPLDSTHLIFKASVGKFSGNNLFVDRNFKGDKIHIIVTLRKNPAVQREFEIWVKKNEHDVPLKTAEELLNDMQKNRPPAKKKRRGIFG